MKTCAICKETKFWFQFFTTFEGYFYFTYDICKRCANDMREESVRKCQYKINKKSL